MQVHNYRMETTKHRTSFALDVGTADRIRRLARLWKVSQAEVVRRAVAMAEQRARSAAGSVGERLQEYRSIGRIPGDAADAYLKEIAEDRSRWGRDR